MGKSQTKSQGPSTNKGPYKGWIITRTGKQFIVENLTEPNLGLRTLCMSKTSVGEIVVGDYVLWEKTHQDNGRIVQRLPRTSLIERYTHTSNTKKMAANVTAMVIMLAPKPKASLYLLDQYLVAASIFKCEPIIVLNKEDILQTKDDLFEMIQQYQVLDFHCCIISAKHQRGLTHLGKLLSQHTSILLGQSGVGKSSLVKAWLPNENITIGELTQRTSLGRHTTSTSTLYHLTPGGHLIDAPGIREFKLTGKHPLKHLVKSFPDIDPLLDHCKFRNCSHRHEPECAIKAAIKTGALDADRVERFLAIVDEFGLS